jgi:hypothetical protein
MLQRKLGNDLKHYFKEIKSLFPVYSEREKQFLVGLMSEVDEYIALNPDSDYAQLISVFGEPKTIVSQYIAEADATYLLKRIRTARFIKLGVVVVIIAVVIAAASVITLKYMDYVKAQAHYIDREVTEIIE